MTSYILVQLPLGLRLESHTRGPHTPFNAERHGGTSKSSLDLLGTLNLYAHVDVVWPSLERRRRDLGAYACATVPAWDPWVRKVFYHASFFQSCAKVLQGSPVHEIESGFACWLRTLGTCAEGPSTHVSDT